MLCDGSKFKIISFQVVYFFSGTFSFLHSGWFTALSALSAAALKKLSLSLLSFINFEKIVLTTRDYIIQPYVPEPRITPPFCIGIYYMNKKHKLPIIVYSSIMMRVNFIHPIK